VLEILAFSFVTNHEAVYTTKYPQDEKAIKVILTAT
jgi:hypothetical protein